MSDWHLGSNLMCIFSSVCATKNTGIAQFRSGFFFVNLWAVAQTQSRDTDENDKYKLEQQTE